MGVIFAAIAGLIGAAIWIAIGYGANAEVGWIAWGIGAMVGIGFRMGSDVSKPPAYGFLAAGIAALAVIVGKAGVVYLMVNSAVAEMTDVIDADDETMIVRLADKIVEEKETAGEQLAWPAGKDVESAETEADYPPNIWQEAKQKWDQKPEPDKELARVELREQMKQFADIFEKEVRAQAFKASFTGWDILWFLLACGTAFRISVDDEA